MQLDKEIECHAGSAAHQTVSPHVRHGTKPLYHTPWNNATILQTANSVVENTCVKITLLHNTSAPRIHQRSRSRSVDSRKKGKVLWSAYLDSELLCQRQPQSLQPSLAKCDLLLSLAAPLVALWLLRLPLATCAVWRSSNI